MGGCLQEKEIEREREFCLLMDGWLAAVAERIVVFGCFVLKLFGLSF